MNIKQLQDILDNKYEIPNPEIADICFYLEDKDGNCVDLKLKRIGAFDILTDITFTFEIDENPQIIKPIGYIKFQLKERRYGKMSEIIMSEQDFLYLRDISIKLREIAKENGLNRIEICSLYCNENDKDSYVKFANKENTCYGVLSDSLSKYMFESYSDFIKKCYRIS